MIAAIALAGLLTAPIHAHPAGCSCAYLPDYDHLAGYFAQVNAPAAPDSLSRPGNPNEPMLKNVRQLTFGGQNAEAYWNVDGDRLIYQTRQPMFPDEQIFTMKADGSGKTLVSTGKGRTTCSYFTPDGQSIYFSSTHDVNEGAQKPIDMTKGYVWMVNPQFSLWRVGAQPFTGIGSSAPLTQILKRDGYVAETTIAPNGRYMTWTGDFEGDLEIYRSDLDGRNVRRLTREVGYDGGPFISWDSKKIVYRRDTIDSAAELADYRKLHAEHLVRPSRLEIWIMDADGSHKRQVTHLNAASFAPFLHPDGKRIVFASNFGDPKGREFDLFLINVDGTGFRRLTKTRDFDGFPMFTRDGKKLVWASNRFGTVRGETNIFVADFE